MILDSNDCVQYQVGFTLFRKMADDHFVGPPGLSVSEKRGGKNCWRHPALLLRSEQPSAWKQERTTSWCRVTTLRLSWNTILKGAITPQWARHGRASLRDPDLILGLVPHQAGTRQAINSSRKEPRWANDCVAGNCVFWVISMGSKQLTENERISSPPKNKGPFPKGKAIVFQPSFLMGFCD